MNTPLFMHTADIVGKCRAFMSQSCEALKQMWGPHHTLCSVSVRPPRGGAPGPRQPLVAHPRAYLWTMSSSQDTWQLSARTGQTFFLSSEMHRALCPGCKTQPASPSQRPAGGVGVSQAGAPPGSRPKPGASWNPSEHEPEWAAQGLDRPALRRVR